MEKAAKAFASEFSLTCPIERVSRYLEELLQLQSLESALEEMAWFSALSTKSQFAAMGAKAKIVDMKEELTISFFLENGIYVLSRSESDSVDTLFKKHGWKRKADGSIYKPLKKEND